MAQIIWHILYGTKNTVPDLINNLFNLYQNVYVYVYVLLPNQTFWLLVFNSKLNVFVEISALVYTFHLQCKGLKNSVYSRRILTDFRAGTGN